MRYRKVRHPCGRCLRIQGAGYGGYGALEEAWVLVGSGTARVNIWGAFSFGVFCPIWARLGRWGAS